MTESTPDSPRKGIMMEPTSDSHIVKVNLMEQSAIIASCPTISVLINEIKVTGAHVDTGSALNLMSLQMANKLELELQHCLGHR